MVKKMGLKKLGMLFLSLLLIFAMMIGGTYSALTATKTATGVINISPIYSMVISKESNINKELSSSSINIKRNFFDGVGTATINLGTTTETATSINNGTITGNFKKYSWGIDGVNFASESLVYTVYASNVYSYYPTMKFIVTHEGTAFEEIHLSFKTEQNKIYSIRDEQGTYYSYYVSTNDYNYVITFPTQSTASGGAYQREVTCVVLDNTYQAKRFTGTSMTEINFKMKLNDIVDGIYFESDYSGSVTFKAEFSVDKNFAI